MIIIMRFSENNFWDQNKSIYINFGGSQGGVTWYTLHFLFIFIIGLLLQKPILKSNSTSFWFKTFFHMMNNKNFRKRGPQGARLIFLYEVRIVVLIHFIAILLTAGIFLIQIVTTNIYLILFYSKNNIKMHFSKKLGFKVLNPLQTFIIHRNTVK